MKKLKLESLEVTSFDTSPAPSEERGTVNANAKPGCSVVLQTYSPQACGETNYMDCTYGCSYNTDCPYRCVAQLETVDCAEV